jgi:hypothetical protein
MLQYNYEITNYCACSIFDRLPLQTQFNQKNIICNSWILHESEKQKFKSNNFLLDSDGINISHLNYTFAELTASFYIWKNKLNKNDIVSFTHYRRFWDNDKLDNLNFDNVICVPNKEFLNKTAYNHFVDIHRKEGIDFSESLLNGNFSLKKKHFLQLKNIDFVYPSNMIICKKSIYDRIYEICFEFLFEVYKHYFLEICQKNDYQRRFIGFLSERVLTIILENSEYYLGKINKNHCKVIIHSK